MDAINLRELKQKPMPELLTMAKELTIENAPGQWRLELDLKDRRASLAVKDVFFHIEPATGALHLMEFQLRDGSLLRTRITQALKNLPLPKNLFIPNPRNDAPTNN